MNEYYPDNWVIIKFNGPYPHYCVLAGWSGGYATSDSWRMNIGIVRHEFDGEYWRFYGISTDSCYVCHVDSYGLRMSTAGVWGQLQGEHVEMIEDQAWIGEDWDWILK